MFHKASYKGIPGHYCIDTGRLRFGDKVFENINDVIIFFGK
jgi:hypothetical protein